jgi:hypothetical protein
MKNKHIQAGAAAVALLFALAPFAHAAIDIKGAVDVDMDDKMEMGAKAGVTTTAAPVKMEMDDDEGEMHMMGEGEMMEGEEREMGMDRAQMMADEHALDVLADVELRLDLRKGGDDHAAGTREVDTAAKVKSEHDLEDFMHHKAKADMHLKGVEVKDGKVEVKYAQPAKFFGFMKTTINARASVDAKDTVEVKYPWYHIFMKKHVSQASMQSNIARAVAAERKGMMEGMATTTMQAEIEAGMGIPNLFEIIANELQSARVKAEAEASGSVAAE